ncbi:glycoside hydrolase family 3 N-terminal domain-containing protein [Propionibacteriaceae bacterium G1746]|uniref:glycoside hydrolase family 3 N-terminal domain-containing protein n=1 Tax=Aestuariimicrobium sp. G57 TaxID=3418485 RepID=UPI003C297052
MKPAAALPDLTDDQRAAALGVLMPGFAGTSVPAWLAAHVRDGLGGVCLFAMNTPDIVTTRALCDELSALNPDLCITTDEEGGDVSRLQAATGSWLPGNEALGALDDAAVTRSVGAAIGSLVRAAGVHLTIAPVLDVASNKHNPVISVRAFGATPDLVARHGRAFIDGLHQAGVGGCAKHFPGHGDTAVDSHVGLPVIDVAQAVLADRDVAPFAAVADAVDAVMTAHIVVPAHGPHPATLSAWAYDLLRSTGFDGPVITDALGMAAIAAGDADHRAGMGEGCVRALEAGADLLCLDAPQNRDGEDQFAEAYAAIGAALLSGRLSVERLRASAGRTRACVRTITARPGWRADAPADLGAIRDLGDRVAVAALAVTGDVLVRNRGWLVDLRRSTNWAAGDLGSVVLDTLNEAADAAGTPRFTPITASHVREVPADDTVVVVTRQPLVDGHESAGLESLLALRPDAVVLHTGMAHAAPAARHVVCTHGLGLPNLRAAAAALQNRGKDGRHD